MVEGDHPGARVARGPEGDHEQARLDLCPALEAPRREVGGQAAHGVGVARVLSPSGDREVLARAHAGIDPESARPRETIADPHLDAGTRLGADRRCTPAAARYVAVRGRVEARIETVDCHRRLSGFFHGGTAPREGQSH
jgi:hypothetical protein